jgi:hypothetical protein
MLRWEHRACAVWLAWLLALFSIAASPLSASAHTATTASAHPPGLYEYTQVSSDGALTLAPTAPPAPAIYGSFSRFGSILSPQQQLSFPVQALTIRYLAHTPAGSALRIDVRASNDGQRWTAWEIDLANGGRATFDRPVRIAQYRATLLGNGHALPSVRAIEIVPEHGSALFSAMSDNEPVAPTWKLRATRMGMVGGRTANGHIITKHDHFVSLPSWRSLSPKGTSDYAVRITYNGRSSVAPVYDVGPWNVHDDYWNTNRERFKDLPVGWPEDHAAYYDGYNKGWAEKGKVRFPTAVDIGDGVWWDDLGIKGDQATVEITFLWLGRDPLATPPPAEAAPAPPAEATPPPAEATPPPTEAAPAPPAPPAEATPPPTEAAPAPPAPPAEATPPPAEAVPAPPAEATPPPAEAAPPPAPPVPTATAAPPPAEIVVDNHMDSFRGQAAVKWYDSPKNCGANAHALWTYTTTNPDESENSGIWRPTLATEATYDVYVNIPGCKNKKPNTTSAHYFVHHRDGVQEVVVDQNANAGKWVHLGRFPFSKGDSGTVELRDVTGDSMRTIWFDAVKWVVAP